MIPESVTPDPLVDDKNSSSQGLILIGGIAILGVLLWLALSQLASDEAVAPLGAGLAGDQTSEAGSVSPTSAGETPPSQSTTSTTVQITQPSTSPRPDPSIAQGSPEEAQPPVTQTPASQPEDELSVEVVGDPLPTLHDSGVFTSVDKDPAIGMTAPSFEGLNFDGEIISVSPDGSNKVVIFVAHWCPHCQREIPQIVDLIEAGQLPTELEIYAVSTAVESTRGNYPPQAWLENERWLSPVIQDTLDYELFFKLGGNAFPYAIYLDGDNKVLARSAGSLEVSELLALWELTDSAD